MGKIVDLFLHRKPRGKAWSKAEYQTYFEEDSDTQYTTLEFTTTYPRGLEIRAFIRGDLFTDLDWWTITEWTISHKGEEVVSWTDLNWGVHEFLDLAKAIHNPDHLVIHPDIKIPASPRTF